MTVIQTFAMSSFTRTLARTFVVCPIHCTISMFTAWICLTWIYNNQTHFAWLCAAAACECAHACMHVGMHVYACMNVYYVCACQCCVNIQMNINSAKIWQLLTKFPLEIIMCASIVCKGVDPDTKVGGRIVV